MLAVPALQWRRDFSRTRAGHSKAGAVPCEVLTAQLAVGSSISWLLICLLCNHRAGEGAVVGSGRCRLSPGTVILNAEAGAAPSPAWEHRHSARRCAPGACKGLAALPSFPGLCPAGEQRVVSEPPDIAWVGLQKADTSSPSFFLRRREGHLSPPGSGGQRWAMVPLSGMQPHRPFKPPPRLHVGVSTATPRQTKCCPRSSWGATPLGAARCSRV